MKKRFSLISILLLLAVILVAGVIATNAQNPPKEPSFTFAVFGDNQPNRPDGTQSDTFRAILKSISAMNPSFAVSTGDRIYGSSSLPKIKAQYQDYKTTVESILKPRVYLAIGDHEIQGHRANEEYFSNELGGTYYSFDHGDSHFIVLDSEVVGQSARITGDQLDWFRDDLQTSRAARHKFVFLHRPLFPVDGHMGSSMDKYPKDRDALHSLFVRNRIKAVFVGHEHLFNVQKRNGVTYVITGGAGAFVFPSIDGQGDFHHYVMVSVNGDKVEMKLVKPALNGEREEVLPINPDESK